MKLSHRIALITLVALIVVVGVWYVALWHPAQKNVATLRAQQAVAAANVMTLQAQVDNLRAEQKQLPRDRALLAKFEASIPTDPGLDQLIKVINNAVNEAGMSLTSIGTPAPSGWGVTGPAAVPTGPGPQSIAISIGVQGSDVGMLRLVTDLDSEPRLLVVNSLSLDSAPSASGASNGASSATSNAYSVSATAFFVSVASNNPVFPGDAVGG